MKLFDYVCENGHEEKDAMFLDTEVPPDEKPCASCDKITKRVTMYPNAGVRLPMAPTSFPRGF